MTEFEKYEDGDGYNIIFTPTGGFADATGIVDAL
jgi:hypothetical protein